MQELTAANEFGKGVRQPLNPGKSMEISLDHPGFSAPNALWPQQKSGCACFEPEK